MIRSAISLLTFLATLVLSALWIASYFKVQYANTDLGGGHNAATWFAHRGGVFFVWQSPASNNTDYGTIGRLLSNASARPGLFEWSKPGLTIEIVIVGAGPPWGPGTKATFIRQTWFKLYLWPLILICMAVGTPFWLTGPVRRFRRRRRGLCVKCGYNQTGNTSGVCPECGTQLKAIHSTPTRSPQRGEGL